MNGAQGKTGGCQCGNIRHRLNAEAKIFYACHCTDCQKQSGSAVGLSLRMDPADLEFLQGGNRLRLWDTRGGDGEPKRCAFCSDCGTRLYHGGEDPAAQISIKAGSLDDTGSLNPIAHIWLASAQPWVEIDRKDCACFEREPDDESLLEQRWRQQRARDRIPRAENDGRPARCT